MIVSEIRLYEMLKAKIGEREAEAFVEILETKVNSKFEEGKELLATKKDLSDLKAEIIKWMFIFWVGQIGVIIAILTIFFKR
jgi:hypothetical protein